MNTVALKLKYSPKLQFFFLLKNFSPDLFFSELKYSPKLQHYMPRH
jgi:hypothetical protein